MICVNSAAVTARFMGYAIEAIKAINNNLKALKFQSYPQLKAP